MSRFIEIGLCNLAMATVLAIIAAIVSRCFRKPALSHALWLLVLVKLITPPLISVPVISGQWLVASGKTTEPDVPARGEQDSSVAVRVQTPEPETPASDPGPSLARRAEVDENDTQTSDSDQPSLARRAQTPMPDFAVAADLPKQQPASLPVLPVEEAAGFSWSWLTILQWSWILGSVGLALLALVRIGRFQNLLRHARPAPDEVVREARQLAKRMHVRCPGVILMEGVVTPMVWVMGWQSRLLLPAGLLERLSTEQRQALLAHELAHLRRGDPWVRHLEMAVLAIYWWCPLVWWARHELREAEEECCDAWVVWALPGSARAYALALVETVDFLAGARPALPALASGFGQVHFLRRRLTMIMRGNTPRALTIVGALAVLAAASLVMPWLPVRAVQAQEEPPKERKAGKDDPKFDEFRKLAKKLEAEREALREKQMELEKKFRELFESMRKEGIRPPFGKGPKGDRGPDDFDRPKDKPFRGKDGDFRPPFGPGRDGPGRDGPGMEHRLSELERVLEHALREIHNLRRELGGPRGPEGRDRPPGDGPGRPGGEKGRRPPRGPGDGPGDSPPRRPDRPPPPPPPE